MKLVGIIAEYNPFHNGHQYQVAQARKQSGASHVVAVMSGHFVQRGEPALVDKWARAEMALRGGVDLVIELPTVFCCQCAQRFAEGGVALLEALGVTFLSFGVETNDWDKLTEAAALLQQQPQHYRDALKQQLATGVSYPAAQSATLKQLGYGDVIDTPNNLLAVEYLKAISAQTTPVPVVRKGSLHDGVGSASHIRQLLAQDSPIDAFVPASTLQMLEQRRSDGTFPLRRELLDTAALAVLRSMSVQALSHIRDVGEGLQHRIKRAAQDSPTLTDTIDAAKTKRYTHARLRRIAVNALLGITAETERWQPQYVRVLAANQKGREILYHAKQRCPLPIITKTADAPKSALLDYDVVATDLYALGYPDVSKRVGGADWRTSPVME